MGSSRRVFTKEFKAAAVQRLQGSSAAEVAQAVKVHPKVLLRWRRQALGQNGNGRGEGEARSYAVSFRLNRAEFERFQEAYARADAGSVSDFTRDRVMQATARLPIAQLEAQMHELTLAMQRLTLLIREAERFTSWQ